MSMSAPFDTLQYAEDMRAAGWTDEQAKAGAKALSAALGEAMSGQVATKDDISRLELKMVAVESELQANSRLIRWIGSVGLAGIGALILKAFF